MSATDFAVEKVVIAELTLDYCDNVFSQSPCTATRNPGSECYNTFGTCLDQANYATTDGFLYRFTLVDGPILRGVQAYRSLVSVRPVSGKIDQRKGLGGRDQVTLNFVDFVDDDARVDPYRATRAEPQGTFWRRLLARNRNYVGRWLVIKEGYLAADGYLDESSMTSRRYVLESVEIAGRGAVRVVARDPLKLTERVQIPTPSDAELSAAITDVATSLTLKSGHNVSTGSVTLRIDDEILTGTLSGDTVSSLSRAQYGTTAAAHSADRRVQECKVWNAQNIDDVWSDILTTAGLSTTYQDTAGAAAEVDLWHPSISIDGVVISKPTAADKLLRDLMEQTSCLTWWEPKTQKAKLRAIHPRVPGQTGTAITDTAHIVVDSTVVKYLESERVTRVVIYYGIEDWSRDFSDQDPDQPAYTRVQYVIDADAETAEEYGDERARVIFAYFLGSSLANEVKAAAFRTLSRLRDAPRQVTLTVTDKVADALRLGDDLDLTTDELVDTSGAPVTTQALLMGSKPPAAGDIEYTLTVEPTDLEGRWAFYHDDRSGEEGDLYTLNADEWEATTNWTGSTDVSGIAVEQANTKGEDAITFDKSGTSEAFGGIQNVSLAFPFGQSSEIKETLWVYLPDLTDVANVDVRRGTGASNYWTWRFADSELSAGWNLLEFYADTSDPHYLSTTGTPGTRAWDTVAVYVYLDAAGDTLSGIIVSPLRVATFMSQAEVLASTVAGDESTLEAAYQSTSGWSAIGDATNIAVESTNLRDSSGGITWDKSSAHANFGFGVRNSTLTSVDLTKVAYESFWFFIPANLWDNLNSGALYVYRGKSGAANYRQYRFLKTDLSSGWNHIKIWPGSPSLYSSGASVDDTDATYLGVMPRTDDTTDEPTGAIILPLQQHYYDYDHASETQRELAFYDDIGDDDPYTYV